MIRKKAQFSKINKESKKRLLEIYEIWLTPVISQ